MPSLGTRVTLMVPPVPTLFANGAEFLPTLDGGAVCVGPAQASGEVFKRDSASVALGQVGGFSVNVELRSDGEAAWNSLATQCFNQLPTCPSTGIDANGASRPGQIAIVLDGVVQSAPVVNTPVCDGNVSITGSFSQEEAEQLADVLNQHKGAVRVVCGHLHSMIVSSVGPYTAISAPSPCSTFAFDTRPDAPVGFFDQGDGCLLHRWADGDFQTIRIGPDGGSGPFPFWAAG